MSSRTETRTLECDPDARVRVENDAGRIEVVAWEHDRVELTVERHAADEADLDKLRVEFSGSRGEVLVTYTTTEPLVDGWVDFHVKCPRVASLDLHNASGEVLVSGFHGPSRASTASGTIRAARMSGTSTFTSASGAISGAAMEGTVYARSASGSVTLHGELTGNNRVETASGAIDIDAVNGSVDARSASGKIDVAGRLRGRCSLRTVSGDIHVRLLPGSDVSVRSRGAREPVETRGTGLLVLETTSGEIELSPAN